MSNQMTATETLRALLDERGVEWRAKDWTDDYSDGVWSCTGWNGYVAVNKDNDDSPNRDGKVFVSGYFTPEQAVEATLGRGTCQVDSTENWLPAERYHRCKHCGAFFAVLDASSDIPPRFCPNCGRKVKS